MTRIIGQPPRITAEEAAGVRLGQGPAVLQAFGEVRIGHEGAAETDQA